MGSEATAKSWFIEWPTRTFRRGRSDGPAAIGRRVRVQRPSDPSDRFLLKDALERTGAAGEDVDATQLFRVTAIEGFERSIPLNPHYCHCTGFTFAEELPIWRAFGPHGLHVPDLLRFLRALPRGRAERLAAHFRGVSVDEWPYQNENRAARRACEGTPHYCEDARYQAAQGASLQVHRLMIRLAPGDALDEDALVYDKVRLAEPGWLGAVNAASAFVRAVILPDDVDDATRARLVRQWVTALEGL